LLDLDRRIVVAIYGHEMWSMDW